MFGGHSKFFHLPDRFKPACLDPAGSSLLTAPQTGAEEKLANKTANSSEAKSLARKSKKKNTGFVEQMKLEILEHRGTTPQGAGDFSLTFFGWKESFRSKPVFSPYPRPGGTIEAALCIDRSPCLQSPTDSQSHTVVESNPRHRRKAKSFNIKPFRNIDPSEEESQQSVQADSPQTLSRSRDEVVFSPHAPANRLKFVHSETYLPKSAHGRRQAGAAASSLLFSQVAEEPRQEPARSRASSEEKYNPSESLPSSGKQASRGPVGSGRGVAASTDHVLLYKRRFVPKDPAWQAKHLSTYIHSHLNVNRLDTHVLRARHLPRDDEAVDAKTGKLLFGEQKDPNEAARAFLKPNILSREAARRAARSKLLPGSDKSTRLAQAVTLNYRRHAQEKRVREIADHFSNVLSLFRSDASMKEKDAVQFFLSELNSKSPLMHLFLDWEHKQLNPHFGAAFLEDVVRFKSIPVLVGPNSAKLRRPVFFKLKDLESKELQSGSLFSRRRQLRADRPRRLRPDEPDRHADGPAARRTRATLPQTARVPLLAASAAVQAHGERLRPPPRAAARAGPPAAGVRRVQPQRRPAAHPDRL